MRLVYFTAAVATCFAAGIYLALSDLSACRKTKL